MIHICTFISELPQGGGNKPPIVKFSIKENCVDAVLYISYPSYLSTIYFISYKYERDIP